MLSTLQGHAHPSLGLLIALNGFLQEIEIADHDTQHVVEIMRDPARERANRLKLAGVEQILLHLLALGNIKPHPEEFARMTALILHHDRLIEKMPFDTVGATPAILEIDGTLFLQSLQLGQDALPVIRIDPRGPEIRALKESLRPKPRNALDTLVGEMELSMILLNRGCIKRNRK